MGERDEKGKGIPMMISLTGTPGVGKTAISDELRKRGYEVLDLNKIIRDNGLLEEKDEERDTFSVDIDALELAIGHYVGESKIFMEGHLSHYLGGDPIIVIRCDPETLAERLRKRGYSENKIKENVQAEILDVILCEAAETESEVFEIVSDSDVSAMADKIEDILERNIDKYAPGNVDWTGELDKWF